MKQKVKLGEHETEIDSLSEDEVKGIMETTLDDRLSKLEIPASLDVDAFKKDILGEVTSLFESHKSESLDEDAFVKKIEKSFEGSLGKALKGIGGGGGSSEPKQGWLTRALFS